MAATPKPVRKEMKKISKSQRNELQHMRPSEAKAIKKPMMKTSSAKKVNKEVSKTLATRNVARKKDPLVYHSSSEKTALSRAKKK